MLPACDVYVITYKQKRLCNAVGGLYTCALVVYALYIRLFYRCILMHLDAFDLDRACHGVAPFHRKHEVGQTASRRHTVVSPCGISRTARSYSANLL